MPLSPRDVIELAHDQLFPLWRKEHDRLERVDKWYRWRHEDPVVPRTVTREMRHLIELCKTPWLGLVVTTVAQGMYVDGYASPTDAPTDGPWMAWQANDFDNRQSAIHRAALAYGLSYATALPGVDPRSGAAMTVLRGHSPRKMIAVYADPAEDDWPMYALRVESQPGDTFMLRTFDEECAYYLSCDSGGDSMKFIERRDHRAGVTPVVRYANMLDLDGRSDGEVEPFIPLAARINKTAFDRLITQHFASWKVRTVSGMARPDSEEEANREKLKLRQDDLLVAEDPDTKFGTLDETPLDGFIKAYESDVEALAAVSQTPAHDLTGVMANLSADAIAAAEAGLQRKIAERERSFGKSHAQLLRLDAHLRGDEAAAGDVMARVTWADTSSRSLSQAVDALGKAATMLSIPPEALWSRIPGVTKLDVDEWKTLAAEGGPSPLLGP